MKKKVNRKKRTTTCGCIGKINDALEKQGRVTRVCSTFSMSGICRAEIAVEKSNRSSRERLGVILPTYCPFCGKKYPGAKTDV